MAYCVDFPPVYSVTRETAHLSVLRGLYEIIYGTNFFYATKNVCFFSVIHLSPGSVSVRACLFKKQKKNSPENV